MDGPGCLGSPGNYFDGLIDEVSVYDRALSAPEILAIFNAGSAGKCKYPGACCLVDDSCLDFVLPTECASLGGFYQGNDSNCTSLDCPVLPIGQWTVISHGANAGGGPNVPFWILLFAFDLYNLDPDHVQTHSMDPATFAINPPGPFSTKKHHVLKWNWSETSAVQSENGRLAPDGYAYAAGDALFAFLKHHGIADRAKYFFGHSRGSVVVSEAVRRLILDGNDPRQVIYLDGEGGNCGGLGYQDDRFDAWRACNPANEIRYDAVFSTYPECCYPGCNGDFGGLPQDRADDSNHPSDRLNLTNLRDQYRHGEEDCDDCGCFTENCPCVCCPLCDRIVDAEPIWQYLFTHMTFDDELYRWPNQPPDDNPLVSPPRNANDWDGYPNDNPMFNGDLEWETAAGWRNHGGGGEGTIDSLLDTNNYLQLTSNSEWRDHNWFWLPERFDRLTFRYKIYDSDFFNCDDSFRVDMIRHAAGFPVVTAFSTTRCDQTGWIAKTFTLDGSLAQFRGSLCKVRFIKLGGDLDSGTRVNGPDAPSFLAPCQSLPTAPLDTNANPSVICSGGDASTLMASVPGAVIDWYTGACGGTLVGTGNSLVVSPGKTTTYFAQARSGSCSSLCCGEVTLSVLSELADLNGDCDVGGADLGLLLGQWTP